MTFSFSQVSVANWAWASSWVTGGASSGSGAGADVEAASLPGGPVALETPERILLRETLDADLQAALDDIPEAFREAVWLRDVEEFTYAEMAAMLDVPIGTVMSRISRGRRALFDRLQATRGPAEVRAGARLR